MRRLIGLMTDYGYRDVYVGVVKAVIKSINQDAEIIDITHGITRHDVLEAAVMLNVSADYFPRGTIFLVVVDPGLGTTRRALLLKTTRYVLVGPDNGCLTLLAERDGVKGSSIYLTRITDYPRYLKRFTGGIFSRQLLHGLVGAYY